jgi:hypothetical protein
MKYRESSSIPTAALHLLTPEAFVAFLPAYLQRAFLKLVQENSGDPEWNRRGFSQAFEKIWV